MLIDSEEILMIGVILTELIQGTRSEKEQRLIKEGLLALPYIEVARSTWILAGKFSSKLQSQGLTIALPDLTIAALAREHNCSVYSLDKDFQRIPEVRLYTPARQ